MSSEIAAETHPPSNDAVSTPRRRSHREWWRDAVVHEVYPRSFMDS